MSLSDALLLDPHPFEIWIALRSDGAKGSGTLNDPFDGGVGTTFRFDEVMRKISSQPGAALVHLGPGTFETNGYSDDADVTVLGWQMKAQMRIVGAGTDATTLKLVGAYLNSHYFAIGHRLTTGVSPVPNPLDFCEVSDLTIDCDVTGQPSATVACGAVRLMGNHVKIERVKAKYWGNKGSSPKACFVFAALTGDYTSAGSVDVSNAGIQNCVAVEPASTAGPITVFHAGGREAAAANEEVFGKGPYIRRCFADCASLGANALTADIRALSMGWCRAGVIEQNQIHNLRIGGPYQDKATTREIVVRSNTYQNVVRGPYWKLGLLNAALSENAAISGNGTTATATFANVEHGFSVGDRVKLTPPPVAAEIVVQVTEVPTTKSFKFKSALSGPAGQTTVQKMFGSGNILVERNIIELATGAAGEIAIHVDDGKSDVNPPGVDATVDTPEYAHTEVVIRENRIRYLNGDFDATWTGGRGIRVSGTKNVLVRDNVIECAPANPMENFRCGTAQYFNNKTPRGVLIQGHNGPGQTRYSELETESEDALVLSLL
jgi:hypothetical protein